MARITRPALGSTQEDLRRYLRELGRALEEAGVDYGEPFTITKAGATRPGRYELDRADRDEVGAAAPSPASVRAALANLPRTGTQRRRILELAVEAGERGVTSDEVSDRLGILLQSAKPRMLELRTNGWLRFNGKQRPSKAGATVEVMTATDAALAQLGFLAPPPAVRRPIETPPEQLFSTHSIATAPASAFNPEVVQ
jgi:hypothetical protein